MGGDPQHLLDMRHLVLRGENSASVMIVRDAVEHAFNVKYHELGYVKVAPPALVQTQVEGGSTLFDFNYYGEKAYLTQSSQLYLETVLPFAGNCYCIEKSFRAEKSLTRRHLSEYTHVEAELDFINFDDLLEHLEDIICGVLSIVMANPRVAAMLQELNPEFQMPERPFKRMKYSDAIDCLMPGVGEIVGGSMRMYDYDELMQAYSKVGIPAEAYYWYTDQRRYGTSPHD